MDYLLLLFCIAGFISWGIGIEWKRIRHKRQVEENYREYKNRAK